MQHADLVVTPVAPDRWPDVVALFGPQGAYFGCWCGFFDFRRKDFAETRAAERRELLRQRVEGGDEPGLLAYRADAPVGWVRLGPRGSFPHLAWSRNLRPEHEDPTVWALVCFVIAPAHRRTGVMGGLIDAAVAHVAARGGRAVEAYPVLPRELTGCDGFTGLVPAFERAGFHAVRQATPRQLVMRRDV